MSEEPEVVDDSKEVVFSKHSMMDGPKDSQTVTPYLRPAQVQAGQNPSTGEGK